MLLLRDAERACILSRQLTATAWKREGAKELEWSMHSSIDPGVSIGHVHLKVADLERAHRVLLAASSASSVMQRYGPGAAFLSAGGYHHHIGLNTWESQGGAPPPPGHDRALPRRDPLPDAARPGRCAAAIADAGMPLDGASDHGVSEALYLRDPDENGVELYWDRPKDAWPRTPDGQVAMFTRALDLAGLLAELDAPTAGDALGG